MDQTTLNTLIAGGAAAVAVLTLILTTLQTRKANRLAERALVLAERAEGRATAEDADVAAHRAWTERVRGGLRESGGGAFYPVPDADRAHADWAVRERLLVLDPGGDGVMLPSMFVGRRPQGATITGD